jgi:uncharacterized membrane protein YesL
MIEMNTGLMREAGVTDEAFDAWRRELEYANLAGTFYMGFTMFLAVGRKP